MRVAHRSAKEDRAPSIRDLCSARGQHLGAMEASSPDAPEPDGARDPSRPVLQTGARRADGVGRTLQRRRGDRHLGGFARVGGGHGHRKRRRQPQKHAPQHRFGDRDTREPPHSRRTPGRSGSSARARHSPRKPAGDALRDGPSGTFQPPSQCATPRRKQHAIRAVDRAAPGLHPWARCSLSPAGHPRELDVHAGFPWGPATKKHAEKKRLLRRVDRTVSVTANPSGATASRPGAAGAPPQPALSLGGRPRIHTAKGSCTHPR